ncbi:MAG: hypothetical protein MUO67_08000 [Anaerolineales bacterium]|jgi:succinate dehydrogenase / fumarate reductase membrane anchor subunit|nr:hypothetical protein [Anaerolineales bacterium]
MSTNQTTVQETQRYNAITWKWVRYSAFLLIPLVWIHSIIQALITGGHNLSLEYVQMRWLFIGWRVYDLFILAFAFSHGALGLRQVLLDYVKPAGVRKVINWVIIIFWLVITAIGAIALFGGVRMP